MANSYPKRDQARGIWKINDITKNIKGVGTYPQTSDQNTALYAGGDTPSTVATIDTVQINTTGNGTDFGDLLGATTNAAANGSFVRAIYCNGYWSGSNHNEIQAVNFASGGNMANYGDMTISARARAGGGNNIKTICGGGFVSGNVNTIDIVTNATLGNATDFGDRTVSVNTVGGAANTTRFLMAGGSAPTTVIDFVEISTAGNAVDFGDLTVARLSPQAFASPTRCVFAGGQPAATVDYVEFGSLGNATDFGDLIVDVAYQGATGNSIRGIVMGGSATSNDSTKSNAIQMFSIATRANATDFGDLTVARNNGYSCSNGHGGLQEFQPRAPELYSPTGTVVPNGGGVGQLGFYFAQSGAAGPVQDTIGVVNIGSLGNSTDFGNLTTAVTLPGSSSSNTRALRGGGQTPSIVNTIDYWEMSTKGNAADFGDLSVARRSMLGEAGSTTRGLFQGGNTPSVSDVIDYVTIATIGNATDFGNLTVAQNSGGAVSSTTRALCGGGAGPIDVISYSTISSTGNASDFGNLSVARYSAATTGSSTRGVFMGGYVPAPAVRTNVMDYVTIASTGNASDFGDLLADGGLAYGAGASNSVRGIFMGGEIGSSPYNSSVIQYITIASTGNSTDFGNIDSMGQYAGSCSNGHGGLS